MTPCEHAEEARYLCSYCYVEAGCMDCGEEWHDTQKPHRIKRRQAKRTRATAVRAPGDRLVQTLELPTYKREGELTEIPDRAPDYVDSKGERWWKV